MEVCSFFFFWGCCLSVPFNFICHLLCSVIRAKDAIISTKCIWTELEKKMTFCIHESSRGYFWTVSLHFPFVGCQTLRTREKSNVLIVSIIGHFVVDILDRISNSSSTRAFMFHESNVSCVCVCECVCANKNIAATRLGFHINFDVHPRKNSQEKTIHILHWRYRSNEISNAHGKHVESI